VYLLYINELELGDSEFRVSTLY